MDVVTKGCTVMIPPLYSYNYSGTPITGTFGEQCFGLYTEVAFVERLCVLYTNCSFGTWVPGHYIATGLYSEVVVKGGSTVYSYATNL